MADFGSQASVGRALEQSFPDDPLIAEEDAAELRGAENAGLLADFVAGSGGTTPMPIPARSAAGSIAAAPRRSAIGSGPSTRSTDEGLPPQRTIRRRPGAGRRGPRPRRGPGVPEPAAGPRRRFGRHDLRRCPGPGCLFHPTQGGGRETRISVSLQHDPVAARFCESVESGHSAHDESAAVAARLGIAAAPLRLDSQAKYGVVARGEADAYLRLPTRAEYREKIWDHAAGVLIVEEAGGTVTDITGRPLEFTHGRELAVNRGVIVTIAGSIRKYWRRSRLEFPRVTPRRALVLVLAQQRLNPAVEAPKQRLSWQDSRSLFVVRAPCDREDQLFKRIMKDVSGDRLLGRLVAHG